MISLLIYLIIILLICAVAWWIITQIPLPPPFQLVARVVFALIVLLVLVEVLLPYASPGHVGWLR